MNLKFLLQTLRQYLRMPWTAYASDAGDELRQELEFHLMSSAHDHQRTGLSIEESHKAALARFGDLNNVLRGCSDVFTSGQLFWHRAHLLTTMALVFFVGWLFVRATQPQMIQTQNQIPEAATGYSFEESAGDILGSVKGLEGEAVSQANVIAVVKTWPPGGFRQQSYMTTTDADGSFCIEDVYPPDHKYETQVSVVAEGRLLTSRYTSMTTGYLENHQFELAPTNPFAIRFETDGGEPLQNVAVFPSARIDQQGNRHQVYFLGSEPIVIHSDEHGQIPITQFLPGEEVAVAVQFPGKSWQVRELVVPAANQVVVMTPSTFDF